MSDAVSIQFLGAAGTVTGSKFLVTVGERRLLVDCGMFQGLKSLRERNWDAPPVAPDTVDAIVLTHAHIDHTGYLPRFARDGFRRKVFATSATIDLLRILLPDAAHLQEEEAAYANRRGYSKHSPALPLFTMEDADRVLERLRPIAYRTPTKVAEGITVELRGTGHILGAAMIVVEIATGDGASTRILFSGDVGRYDAPILRDPAPVAHADWLVVESTYGGRHHPPADDALEALARIVNESVARGGVLLVPAFAVGRTQTLLYLLRQLEDERRIPRLPVYVDSPMAVKASEFYLSHVEEHDTETLRLTEHRAHPLLPDGTKFCSSREQSKRLNGIEGRAIIISASGMMTGGRILHHAAVRLPDPKNTLLLVGFQAAGTRGRRLLEGETELKIHGEIIPVAARVESLDGFSAHADEDELVRWLGDLREPPRRTFVVHGEPDASAALARRLTAELGFPTHVPTLDETCAL